MICYVSSGTLNSTHLITLYNALICSEPLNSGLQSLATIIANELAGRPLELLWVKEIISTKTRPKSVLYLFVF